MRKVKGKLDVSPWGLMRLSEIMGHMADIADNLTKAVSEGIEAALDNCDVTWAGGATIQIEVDADVVYKFDLFDVLQKMDDDEQAMFIAELDQMLISAKKRLQP